MRSVYEALYLRPMSSATAAALLAGDRPTDVTTVTDYPTEFSAGMAPSVGNGSPLGPFLIHRRADDGVVGDIGGGFPPPGPGALGDAGARPRAGQGYPRAAGQGLLLAPRPT